MNDIPVLFLRKITEILPCSSDLNPSQQSSSSGDLRPEMMESETPPSAAPSCGADDPEVSSRRVSPDQQVVQGIHEGDISAVQSPGNNNKDPGQFGMRLDTNKWIPSKGDRTPAAASGDPEMLDILTNMLRQASISEEHRTLMGTVVERVQSVKSGLTEACGGLLTGFEVSDAKEKIPI